MLIVFLERGSPSCARGCFAGASSARAGARFGRELARDHDWSEDTVVISGVLEGERQVIRFDLRSAVGVVPAATEIGQGVPLVELFGEHELLDDTRLGELFLEAMLALERMHERLDLGDPTPRDRGVVPSSPRAAEKDDLLADLREIDVGPENPEPPSPEAGTPAVALARDDVLAALQRLHADEVRADEANDSDLVHPSLLVGTLRSTLP